MYTMSLTTNKQSSKQASAAS